ncbi:MAG: hypothetical protein ACRYFX_20125 [Janthinobacterium lividum]
MTNTRQLNRYDPADTLAQPAAQTIAWLTGQSAYRPSRLSPAQEGLLRAVCASPWVALPANFPYNRAALRSDYQEAPLLAASVRNSAQFVAALGSVAFRQACARHLQPLLDATSSRLVLLCGSCGLQLFYAALPWLRVPPELHIQLVGLGPVCLRPRMHPQVSVAVVQGRRDWLSRTLCRLPCHQRVPGGHLAYATQPEVVAVVQGLLE